MGLNIFTNIDENVSAFARYLTQGRWGNMQNEGLGNLQYAYVDIDNLWKIGDLRLGRQNVVLGHGIVVADQMDGVRFDKVIDRVKLSAMAMDNKNDVASENTTFYPYDMTRTAADLGSTELGADDAVLGYLPTDDITFFVSPYSWPTVTNTTINSTTYAIATTNSWNGVALDLNAAQLVTDFTATHQILPDYETADAGVTLWGSATNPASLVNGNGFLDYLGIGNNPVAVGAGAFGAPNHTFNDVDGSGPGVLEVEDFLVNYTPTRTFDALLGAGGVWTGTYSASALEAEDANALTPALGGGNTLAQQDMSQYQITDFYGNTSTFDYVGFTKQHAQINDRGFNFMAVAVSVDVGGHRLGAYYASNKYSAYDPYTRLGDPFATISDIDGDGFVMDDINTSPAARPSWMGLTLDGNILKNLDYFLEYVSFDSDIENVGMTADNIFDANWDHTTQDANEQEPWANNLKKGKAWLLGIDWDITEKYNLIASYGEGSEEFQILSIDPALAFNGMEGRWNTGIMETTDSRYYADPHTSLGLNGVKDINIKFNAIFNDTTEGFIQYENVSDNDNSAIRTVAGDQDIVGHPVMDYSIITLNVKHQYRPNTSFGMSYSRVNYGEASVDQLQNSGSWDRIRAEVEVRF